VRESARKLRFARRADIASRSTAILTGRGAARPVDAFLR
jgi:hypothetical protein